MHFIAFATVATTLWISIGQAQYSGSSFRKATLELRDADASGQYVLNLEGAAPELQFNSVTRSLKVKLTKADADYLTQQFKELPVVPKLPAECSRDHARASFQPDDQRPRATCITQDTAYTKKYRSLIRALDLALVKSAGEAQNSNQAVPSSKKDAKAPVDGRN